MEITNDDKVLLLLSEFIREYNKLSSENFQDEFFELIEKTAEKIDKIYT
jgi:hypothetical protein